MEKKKVVIVGSVVALLVIGVVVAMLSFNKKVSVYTVTFDSKGGSLVENQSIEEGNTVVKPVDPTREGYMFVEWSYKNKTYDFSLEVTSDLNLVAKWVEVQEDVETIVFKFNSDGGTTISNQIIEKGKVITKPSDPVKEGYKFLGWFVNDQPYNFDTPVERNIEITAKWEKIEDKNNNASSSNNNTNTNKTADEKKYVVSFNTGGGTVINSQSISEGKKASKPSNPSKPGYGFIGWTLNGKDYNFDSKVNSNIELVAKWLKNPTPNYYLVGAENGKVIYDIGFDYGSYANGDTSIISGWELYYMSNKTVGKDVEVDGVKYSLYKAYGPDAVSATYLDYNQNYKFVARVYILENGKKKYSGWSQPISINTNLKVPTLNGYNVGYTADNNSRYVIHDTGIDYTSYFIGQENYLSGWELYVTSDKNPGNEMTIDGVGYFYHSDNVKDAVQAAQIEIGETLKYRARVYVNTPSGKVYSGWSKVYTVKADLSTPKLSGYAVGNESDHNGEYMIYDISYDHGTYMYDGYNSIVTGWELYVTSDDNPGNEMIIDGVGYFFHGDYPADRVEPAYVQIGKTYKYRARVYTQTSNGKVYSGWSAINTTTGKKLN